MCVCVQNCRIQAIKIHKNVKKVFIKKTAIIIILIIVINKTNKHLIIINVFYA